MKLDASLRIEPFGTTVPESYEPWREQFEQDCALAFANPFGVDHLAKLLDRAARANFVDDDVPQIGTRRIESPQRIGAALSLMLHNPILLGWLEQATGAGPLRAVAGRLVETRANGADALAWHDDLIEPTRRLAVVINLSDRPFTGGRFELQRKGASAPHLTFDHEEPGSMLVFAVRADLEHRVTMVTQGGPRRVFAGWFLSRPEHESGTLLDATLAR